MGMKANCRNRQRGAVAILAGLSIFVLFGFLALVADLGNLYVNKTELQNAADAAALSGAKELVGTSTGINAAASAAIATAALNRSQLGNQPVTITNANIQFSSTSTGPWVDFATAFGAPGDKYFIKVDTSGITQGTLNTWFIRVLNSAKTTTSTFGMAVAGRSLCDALPMFTCTMPGGTAPNYGYVPGREYRFTDTSGSTIGPGNVGYMDPTPPGAPPLNPGASAMRDVICRGKTACMAAGNNYSSLTQAAFGTMADAVNTRMGVFQGALKDAAPQCRPDTNVQEYAYNTGGNGYPKKWMSTAPGGQSEDDGVSLGVHWAAVRPATGATPAVNSSFYPTTGTPYTQPVGSAFTQQPSPQYRPYAQAGRRVLILGLADNCGSINGAGKPVHVVGFARFFMPVKADGTGSPKKFYGEFMNVVNVTPSDVTSIRLYQ